MEPNVSRRQLIVACSGAAALGLFAPAPGAEPEAPEQPRLWPAFPAQDPALVKKAVGASHGRFEELKALIDPVPELAKAAYDWGFGDWEDCIGAASHVGSRECTAYLLSMGARPTIFTHAMLGHLEAVRSIIAAQPGIQRTLGPHGITLMRHAMAGGEAAKEVVAYLDSLGDADQGDVSLPFTDEEMQFFSGEYAFGPGADEKFIFSKNKMGFVVERPGFSSRRLTRIGANEFHPAGAPSARLRFDVESGVARRVVIHNPEPVISAARIGS